MYIMFNAVINIWHGQDLSKLNRDPAKILYVSGNAFESSLQPENCVPIKPYKLEADDTALLDLIPFLDCKSPSLFPLKLPYGRIYILWQM